MNVFVLNTGHCGSLTFIEACRHITNYSSGHQSHIHHISGPRFAYPDNHIEADDRLSWMLGRLEEEYGDNALYVHLSRDRLDTARSFARRMDSGIMQAYREGILMGVTSDHAPLDIALDYISTVEANIELFLTDKSYTMNFTLEKAKRDFEIFWDWIGAEGDLDGALAEWDVEHNASGSTSGR